MEHSENSEWGLVDAVVIGLTLGTPIGYLLHLYC